MKKENLLHVIVTKPPRCPVQRGFVGWLGPSTRPKGNAPRPTSHFIFATIPVPIITLFTKIIFCSHHSNYWIYSFILSHFLFVCLGINGEIFKYTGYTGSIVDLVI